MARLPDEEIQLRLKAALKEQQISDEEALRLWPDMDGRAREIKRTRTEMARARHQVVVDDETGERMFGGPQKGSGARSKRKLVEAIADLANNDRQKDVIDALFAPLASDNLAVRGKGAERIVKIMADHEEQQRRDRDELRSLSKDELKTMLIEGILSSGMAPDLISGLVNQLPTSPVYDVDGTAEAA